MISVVVLARKTLCVLHCTAIPQVNPINLPVPSQVTFSFPSQMPAMYRCVACACLQFSHVRLMR